MSAILAASDLTVCYGDVVALEAEGWLVLARNVTLLALLAVTASALRRARP